MRRLLVSVLLVVSLATACGGDGSGADPTQDPSSSAGPRPLTGDEADRLAVTRFNNYRRRLVPFTMTVPVGEQVVSVTGRADMQEHRALASFAVTNPPAYGVFAWNFATAGLLPTQTQPNDEQLDKATRFPDEQWETHPINPEEPLDAVFLVLLNLALERPDNAQLLRQNGAQWQAATTVDGRDVDVMTATAAGQGQTLTYYVDAAGNLVRVDVVVPGATPATITFPEGEAADVPVITALGPTPDTAPAG